RAGRLVNVALVALRLPARVEVFARLILGPPAGRPDDRQQLPFDVGRHPLLVAADEQLGAVLEPGPDVARLLAHAVLHVDLLRLIAREGEVQAQEAVALPRRQFLFVEELRGAVLFAEEEPVAPGRADRLPLLEKRAERSETRARADHDHRRRRI